MPLFRKKNRDIGKQLRDQASKVSGIHSVMLSPREVCNYFMKVGFDHKGDLQSYVYGKGSSKSVEVKVDIVALAAACAGAPMPECGVFAEVGGKISTQSTKNNLVIAYVAPQEIQVGNRRLWISQSGMIVFLAMIGYKWERGISFSAEVGVKTPDIPGLPSTAGGGLKHDRSVESGTYAELCAFEASAKASIGGEAGISGDRLYVSDTAPTFIKVARGSTMREMEKYLTPILKYGNKKTATKQDVKTFLDHHNRKQKRSAFQKYISGGDISSSKLIRELQAVQAGSPTESDSQQITHYIKSLSDLKAANVLGPYNFVSLWGMKPHSGAAISAEATASVKANVGVAKGGGEATVTLHGPALSTTLKFTRYRLQIASLAESKSKKSTPGRLTRKNASRNPGSSVPSQYIIMTQDTNIKYGQMDLTAFGISGKVDLGMEQTVIDSEDAQFGTKGKSRKKGRIRGTQFGEAKVSGEADFGIEKIGISGEAEAKLKTVLNFMYYESAAVFWAPPDGPGKKKDAPQIQLARGSGFAFGQSVDIRQFYRHLKKVRNGESCGYMKGLAGCIGVTYRQLMDFLKETDRQGDLLDALAEAAEIQDPKLAAHIAVPSAFLIEASFAPSNLPTVEARWRNGRWVLGPGGMGQTLRGKLIPKKIKTSDLQAIRLRYRIADEMNNTKTRFSLGVKYIVSLGLKYNSVEEAGSEGIVNMATVWFNRWKKFNNMPDQTDAYEQCVPQVALLHQ